MAAVVITRTTALFPSAVFVQWDIKPDENGPHVVDVFRAGAPDGPWETVASGLTNAYHFLDKNFDLPPPESRWRTREGVNLLSISREIYYLVTATPPSGMLHQFSSVPTPIEPGLDKRTRLFKRKILRDEGVAFRHLNGIPIIALKRRQWGTRCPECWDPVTKEGTKEHCLRCFGTTFEEGYWAPVLIRGRRTPGSTETNMTPHGDSDVKYVNFITLDYPHLEYNDVLVDQYRNDRFLVQRVTATELKTVYVHQTIAVSEIARDAVEYAVKVDPMMAPPLY